MIIRNVFLGRGGGLSVSTTAFLSKWLSLISPWIPLYVN